MYNVIIAIKSLLINILILVNKEDIQFFIGRRNEDQRLPLEVPDPGGHGLAAPDPRHPAGPLHEPPHGAAPQCGGCPWTDVHVGQTLKSVSLNETRSVHEQQ